MSDQDTKLNNEKDGTAIETVSSKVTEARSGQDVTATADQTNVQLEKTEGTANTEGEAVQAEEDEEVGICGDPCHAFHFLFCAVFPPYMFVWMAVCLKQEQVSEYENSEEERAVREREKEEWFEERRKEKEEKQRKKEEKKRAKEEKRRAKEERSN